MVSLSFMFMLLDWAIRLTVEAYSCKRETIHPNQSVTKWSLFWRKSGTIFTTALPKEASGQTGSLTHREHPPYSWSWPCQLEKEITIKKHCLKIHVLLPKQNKTKILNQRDVSCLWHYMGAKKETRFIFQKSCRIKFFLISSQNMLELCIIHESFPTNTRNTLQRLLLLCILSFHQMHKVQMSVRQIITRHGKRSPRTV